MLMPRHRRGRPAAAAVLALTLAALAAAAPPARETRGSLLLAKDYLERLETPGARVVPLADAPLGTVFPNHLFFVAAYPAGTELKEPLRPVNLLVIGTDGEVKALNRREDLEAAVLAAVAPLRAADPEVLKDNARAALLLARAYYPDARFDVPDDAVQVKAEKRGRTVSARATPTRGGKGTLDVTLRYEVGKLQKVTLADKFEPERK